MALPNLSGSNIQDTFQRVLHTDGAEYFDGTGSVVPIVLANTSPSFVSITASADISASGIITATSFVGNMDGGTF